MKGLWYFAHPYIVKDIDSKNIHLAEEANYCYTK